MSTLNHDTELEEILNARPTDKEVPESVWNDIYATWTGLWTDSYGEWDEQQASDLFPISDLLSEERQAWLVKALHTYLYKQTLELLGKTEKTFRQQFPSSLASPETIRDYDKAVKSRNDFREELRKAAAERWGQE
jgi:hypothetical protein